MWQSLSLPWQLAIELAWESFCDDCYPIGAIITGPEGEILSKGRNRVYPRSRWARPMPGVDNAHAEVEALQRFDYFDVDPHACTLYTTLEPCPMCMGTFYMSGLRTLHFAARDAYGGAVDMLGRTFYLSQKSIQVHGPIPELEPLLIGLIIGQDYIHHDGCLRDHLYYRRYREVLPEGMRLGEALYRSGWLVEMRKCALSTEEMLESLCQFNQSLFKPGLTGLRDT